MDSRKVKLTYLSVSVFLSLLSVSMCLDRVGRTATFLTAIPFLSVLFCLAGYPGGIIRFRLHVPIMLSFFLLLDLMSVNVARVTRLNLCYDPLTIRRIRGAVICDSSFSASGNHLMTISLEGCETNAGDMGSAGGLVVALGRQEHIVSTGMEVILEGCFIEGNLFAYDSILVTRRTWLNDIREAIIMWMENRMHGEKGSLSGLMSSLLLLGRSEDGGFSLKDKAKACGCSHVLVLSGMHLGILAGLCRLVFGKRGLGRAVSMAVISLFLFIAGPRPSLIRAAFIFMVPRLSVELKVLIGFLLQMILFPHSMADLGCCYGYLAVFALVCLNPFIQSNLNQLVGKLSGLIGPSVSVMVFTVPLQMATEGLWHPIAIFSAPIAGLLAAMAMANALLLLAFGSRSPITGLNDRVYSMMESLFDLCSKVPDSRWPGYAILLLSIALLFAVNRLIRNMVLKSLGREGLTTGRNRHVAVAAGRSCRHGGL